MPELTRRQSFGHDLRAARRAAGLSRLELARLVGCPQELIADVELNLRRPPEQLVRYWRDVGFPQPSVHATPPTGPRLGEEERIRA